MRSPIFIILKLIIFAATLGLVSCSSYPKKPDPATAVVTQKIYEDPKYVPKEGSLWPGETSDNLLFADTKAKEVGDVVTVNLEEDFTSTQSATTDTGKDTDLNITTGSVFGLPTNFGISNFLGSNASFDPNINATTSRSTSGSGTTTREGSMTGTMAAIITEILDSGNFRIEGRRTVTINNEDQIMVLEGIIRRVDIGFDNSISSEKIANAAITYTGKGVIADEQKVGWFTRFITYVWPF